VKRHYNQYFCSSTSSITTTFSFCLAVLFSKHHSRLGLPKKNLWGQSTEDLKSTSHNELTIVYIPTTFQDRMTFHQQVMRCLLLKSSAISWPWPLTLHSVFIWCHVVNHSPKIEITTTVHTGATRASTWPPFCAVSRDLRNNIVFKNQISNPYLPTAGILC